MKLNSQDLLRQGVFIGRMTPRINIQRLINNIRPVITEHHLIRLGSEQDGGYLIPDVLDQIGVCYSPGVDVNSSFEIDLLQKYSIGSHLADFSVDSPPKNFLPISFTKKFIGCNINNDTITLEKWLEETGNHSNDDLLLQMDIEGGEYESIIATGGQLLSRFKIIAIEIHNVESWGHPVFFKIVKVFFDKLLHDHYVIHNHPNNCCGLADLGGVIVPRVFELTLIRKDVATPCGYQRIFPNALDRPNILNAPDLHLPRNWYD